MNLFGVGIALRVFYITCPKKCDDIEQFSLISCLNNFRC